MIQSQIDAKDENKIRDDWRQGEEMEQRRL